jgi:hypothetical protein
MASTTDYDSDLAGDTLTATAKKKQTSFDQTNLPPQYQQPASAPAATNTPAGPVGRAALQLPETSVTATAPTAAPTQSLESLRPTGIGDGRSAIYAGVGANGEASFSNLGSTLNTVSKNFTAPNQAPDQRLSTMPGLNPSGVGVQQSAQRYPTSLTDLSPAGVSNVNAAQPTQRSASLTDALPGYTPSNASQSPVAQQQANLADAWRGGSSSGPGFASLGSSSNMGDGIGTFSQAKQGDAALALGRFQRANDLRQGFKDQDRLNNAIAENTRANHTTIVRDSSQPITRADVYRDQQDKAAAQGRRDNITSAQNAITGRQQGRGTEQILQRNARLEDALTAATTPGATDAQRQAYRSMIDPFNEKGLSQQLTQAKIANTQASTAKLNSEANPAGGPKLTEGQSKDYNYYERGNAANGELAGNGNALTGTVDSLIRGIPVIGQSGIGNMLVSSDRQKAEQSGSEFINAILRKDSGAALTKEEQDIYGKTYLPQPGDSPEVLQQKENARTRALKGIQGGLGNVASITSPLNQGAATAPAGNQVASSSPLRVKGHEDVQGLPSGTLFVGPDGKTRRVP